VVDQLTDIPLPGRKFPPPLAGATGSHRDIALPSFVAGPENGLVAATFRQLLHPAPCAAPTVLALFGPSGTGKTHLAHGLVRHWQELHGAEAAHYMTANDFRRQYADAIRADAVSDFRRLVRGRQLLAIDDLHHLPDDAHLMQELRYTVDAYEDQGGTLVVASHRPITALANLSPEVRSRLASGLMLQLAAPGLAARLRIVRQTSAALGRALSDDAAQRLAERIAGTATDLIGALFELCSAPAANGTSDASLTVQVLAARQPSLREIIAIVARYTNVPQKLLKSGSRRQSIVLARSIAVYLARELAGASYHEIGRALGGRDHSTIMYNYRKIDHDRLACPATQEMLDELRRILMSR
jgi:chromosomal replication initiator protein